MITFEQLPYAVAQLFQKLNDIESLLRVKSESVECPEQDQLLNITQAGELLNLTKPTIYALVGRREIPSMKKGKRLYFSKSELIEWIKAGRKKTILEIDAEADLFITNNGGIK